MELTVTRLKNFLHKW